MRPRGSPYVGATKRISLRDARALGSRWQVQQKVDGMLCRLYLNQQGRVARAFSRSGREIPTDLLGGILGARLGNPSAELAGELEAHTEAGNRIASRRGHRLVHLFDCLHDGTRSLVRMPYQARRDALWRMWAEAEADSAPNGRDAAGRFSGARDTQLAPILPQAPIGQLERVWGDVMDQDGEGVVLVNLDAPAGARASKLKCKPTESIDARVVQAARTVTICEWRGSLFSVAAGRHLAEVGDVVEVRHDGFYESGSTPRFPAIVRVRRDLQ